MEKLVDRLARQINLAFINRRPSRIYPNATNAFETELGTLFEWRKYVSLYPQQRVDDIEIPYVLLRHRETMTQALWRLAQFIARACVKREKGTEWLRKLLCAQ